MREKYNHALRFMTLFPMSTWNFYQLLYQQETLFRLPDEQWGTIGQSAKDNATNLVAELEQLSTATDNVAPITNEPIQEATQPEPVTIITLPEPLAQPQLPQLNHKVLLLADEELDPSNLLFLEKILKAVNLNIDGVDLLNLHGVRDMDFAELLRGKSIHHFITFGVPFERIKLDIMMDRYAPVRFEGITFLMADSLPTIEADQNLKRRLWSALQRVFLR